MHKFTNDFVVFLSLYLCYCQSLIVDGYNLNKFQPTSKPVDNVDSDCSAILKDGSILDPGWRLQWYMNGKGNIPADLNVLHAWKKCYNGTDITVAVVDDGIESTTELDVDRSLSSDIDPHLNSTKLHGTAVAGIIAGKRNSKCGIGVAFEAKLVDIRLVTGKDISDEGRSRELERSLEKVDIYSNSYTAAHDGISVHHVSSSLLNYLRKGVSQGRKGKGAIYVWATGNGGHPIFPHGCAYEGYDNNPYVIPVAGVQWNYTKLPTGDTCSSIMVSAFTRDPHDGDHPIITISDPNTCNERFGRNSAAVPFVSGGIALALQANPNLSYRDIMHLLTKTSNSRLPFIPNDFIANAAGFIVSKTFGFGLLDVGLLTDTARNWRTNVPSLRNCTYMYIFDDGERLMMNRTVKVTPNNCAIVFLEHVEVYFEAFSSRAGKLKLDLVSPGGTLSNIVPGRELDRRTDLNLSVISVHFWGEMPFGTWTLVPGDLLLDFNGQRNATTTGYQKCEDIEHEYCLLFGKIVCRKPMHPWAIKNCAKYCSLCSTGATTTGYQKCEDIEHEYCLRYGKTICRKPMHPWAIKNCAKYCSLCSTGEIMSKWMLRFYGTERCPYTTVNVANNHSFCGRKQA